MTPPEANPLTPAHEAGTPSGHMRTSGPLSATLLASYYDLQDDNGPLHARCLADIGRRLLTGAPIPAYQVVTPSSLRPSIEADHPDTPRIDDPRHLDPAKWTLPWSHLCDQLTAWESLEVGRQLTVVKALFKLGFWRTITTLAVEQPTVVTDDRWSIARIQTFATFKLLGRDDMVAPEGTYEHLQRLALDTTVPVARRLGAAINLVVHHARYERAEAMVDRWASTAADLLESSPAGTVSPVLVSAYWRGVSFAPFLKGDHQRVAQMLDEARRVAAVALQEAMGDSKLLALENMRVLLQTCGRAAVASKNLAAAEKHYRSLVRLDPKDPQSHVLLGDFLANLGRHQQARACFLEAARLGAPYTAYALTRVRDCGPPSEMTR